MDTEVFNYNLGKEVAQFVKAHLTNEFIKSNGYKQRNYKDALIETFLKIDELLIKPEGKLELKIFSKMSKEEEELQNQKEKNQQMELFKQLYDVKQNEECDIALLTGCTASVCYINEIEKKIYFANAGDSRSVICKNGVAYPMTIDHKPDMDSEKNRIYKADGWVSEGRVKGNLYYI